jgi:hypothetical protein
MKGNVTATTSEAKAKRTHGRYGDTQMAHVTEGEIVLPLDVQDKPLLMAVNDAFSRAKVPVERYVVKGEEDRRNEEQSKAEAMEDPADRQGYDGDMNSVSQINPETGEEEFFLKGLGKLVKGVAKVALPIAGAALGSMVGMPQLGAMAGSALSGGGGGGVDTQPQTQPQTQASAGMQLPEPIAVAQKNNNQTIIGGGGLKIAQLQPVASIADGTDYGVAPINNTNSGTDVVADLLNRLKGLRGNPATGAQEFYGEGNVNSYVRNEIAAGRINNDQGQKILRDSGFTGEFGNGNAERFFESNADANVRGFQNASSSIGNAFSGPTFSNPNNPHTQVLQSVGSNNITADAAKDLFTRAGFTGVNGGGNAERFFSNEDNAGKLRTLAGGQGIRGFEPVSAIPKPVTAAPAPLSIASIQPVAATRATSVTPIRQPRFRSSRYNVGSTASNF